MLGYFTIIIFGLAIGSFLANFTYRIPKGESIKKGRSRCDHCKKDINWFDNIPVLSYFLLSGKSRCCKKKLSLRYPLIEASTTALFVLAYALYANCATTAKDGVLNGVCGLKESLGFMALPYLLLVVSVLVLVFVIDYEYQIIPDELIFSLLSLAFFVGLTADENLYVSLLSGFGAAVFLLSLNLITLGKGMGLGDVKLVIPLGLILSWPMTLIWIGMSFVVGAVVGVLLIAIGKAEFGRQIPFGPFLVVAFLITLYWGQYLTGYLPVLRLLL